MFLPRDQLRRLTRIIRDEEVVTKRLSRTRERPCSSFASTRMVKQKKNKKKKDLRKKETNGDLNFQRRVFNQIYHVSLKVRAYNDSDLAIQRLYTNISEIQASICLESRLETYQRGCRFVLPEFRITLFVEGFYAPRF